MSKYIRHRCSKLSVHFTMIHLKFNQISVKIVIIMFENVRCRVGFHEKSAVYQNMQRKYVVTFNLLSNLEFHFKQRPNRQKQFQNRI